MFIDEITIKVEGGKGGDGCTSFRREIYVPMGGSDGGNGGKGSDIIFKVDKNLKTLIDLRYQKNIKGQKGIGGKGKKRNGKKAEDIIIKVPEGTTITDIDTNLIIADLIEDGSKVIIAKGGRGGRGNAAFATHDDPAPKFSEYGEPGEERIIKCELKVLADIGFIGMPSVGKSTILSVISSSKPKTAAYHFTTLNPNLRMVKLKDQRSYVVADLPGLIENASKGVGLGDKFLRHAMRTKIIAHIIDIGSFEGRNPIEDYKIIRKELELYNPKLAEKKEIIIANKIDLPDAKNNLEKFQKEFPNKKIIPISAQLNQGIDEMLNEIADILDVTTVEELYAKEDFESHIFYKFENEKPYTITKEDNVWKISGPEIEKLFKMTKFSENEAVMRFARKIRGMGIEEELERLGARQGDDIQILDFLFTFKE